MSAIRRYIKDAIKAVLFDWLYPTLYRRVVARENLDEKKVIFVQGRGSCLSDNFKLIYERLGDDSWHRREALLREYQVSYPQYCVNCILLVREVATARFVFLDDASDVISCLPLRQETKVVQLWHACGAFKKFGMSTADLKFGGSRDQKNKHPFYKNLSLVTVSSPEVVWAYVEAMVLEEDPSIVQALGVSRTDVFFDDDFATNSRRTIERKVPIVANKKIILYAPTFRGRVIDAKGPDRLDVRALKATLGGEFALIVKHHPYVKNPPAIPEDCNDFAVNVNDKDLSIEALLMVADVCISDYSSLVFEYSLFARPMVFFAYDMEEYEDWRGFYYSYEDLTPGPVVSTNDELIDYLVHMEERFDKKKVIDFKERFMTACDGHATDRIVQTVFEA